jgi:sugar phosphate isomerase/epimerase
LKTSRASVQAVRAEYLAVLGAKLLHVHLSENDGTADQHLPPGSAPRSTTAWPDHIRKLKATGYDGTITLEVFSPNKEYLFASRDLLRKWWAQA